VKLAVVVGVRDALAASDLVIYLVANLGGQGEEIEGRRVTIEVELLEVGRSSVIIETGEFVHDGGFVTDAYHDWGC